MSRTTLGVAVLVLALGAVQPTRGDYATGQRAWDAGRPHEARAQWREAAEAGDPRAMLALGRLYAQGLGVIQDFVEAHKWLNLAASRGETDALLERDALAAKMPSTQIAAAQERAAAWNPVSSGGTGTTRSGTVRVPVAAQSASPPPPALPRPTAAREAQALLAALGYDVGPVDGKWGKRSTRAYRAFARDAGLSDTTAPTPDTLGTMRWLAARRGVTPSSMPAAANTRRAAADSGGTLHRAARAGDLGALDAMLTAGTNVDVRDHRGWTPLMHAVNEDRDRTVERLLAARPDPNIHAPDGTTALHIAVSLGRTEIAAMLRRAGADPWLAGAGRPTAAKVARAHDDPAMHAALGLPNRGEIFRDCVDCPEMVVVPEGSYTMGSPPDEPGRWDDEGPRHRVTIARPFAVGRFEVTFAQWDACLRAGGCSHSPGDEGWGRANSPAIDVSWNDAREYVDWLSEKTGRKYRLLTEAEWEYAARARTQTRYYWGDEPGQGRANCAQCGGRWDGTKTASPASFPPNGFGLFDMLGNVWEWVEDCGHPSYSGAPSDASAWLQPGDCRLRMLRGGSWEDAASRVRSAIRYWEFAETRRNVIGFRVAQTLR